MIPTFSDRNYAGETHIIAAGYIASGGTFEWKINSGSGIHITLDEYPPLNSFDDAINSVECRCV